MKKEHKHLSHTKDMVIGMYIKTATVKKMLLMTKC